MPVPAISQVGSPSTSARTRRDKPDGSVEQGVTVPDGGNANKRGRDRMKGVVSDCNIDSNVAPTACNLRAAWSDLLVCRATLPAVRGHGHQSTLDGTFVAGP